MSAQLPELKFAISNLGAIHHGEFTQKPLTVFCGPNNTGKTWAMYSLYHYHKRLPGPRLSSARESGSRPGTDELNAILSTELPECLNCPGHSMENARFGLTGTDSIEPALAFASSTEQFLMPADRNGLHLLFRGLSSRRTALLHRASRGTANIRDLLRDVIQTRYAEPVADYIDWLNSLTEVLKPATGGFHAHAEHLKRHLAGGAYRDDCKIKGRLQAKTPPSPA